MIRGAARPAPAARDFLVAWLLSLYLGWVRRRPDLPRQGGHRRPETRHDRGLGVWSLLDLLWILTGAARDTQGRPVANRDRYRRVAWIWTLAAVVFGMIAGPFLPPRP